MNLLIQVCVDCFLNVIVVSASNLILQDRLGLSWPAQGTLYIVFP